MNKYVLIIATGPVQSFIAAARRSRDLWAGSWMLSEISKAVALSLREQGAQLVFPSPADENDLKPGSKFSVANKIQVVIEADSIQALREKADIASSAARARFKSMADDAFFRLGDEKAIRSRIWQSQLDDLLEVFYGFSIIEDSYAAAAEAASSVMAARKATRNFQRSACSAFEPGLMLPKSSLDGARETVLERELAKRVRLKLRLSESEQLDAAGLIKRLAGNPDQFTPFSRIAIEPWISQLTVDEQTLLCEAYEPLVGLDVASRVTGNMSRYRAFPYDGQLCFDFRLDTQRKESLNSSDDHVKPLEFLRKVLLPLWKKYGHPCPYAVLIQADGDKMGALLDEAVSIEQHIKITSQLSDFSGRVHQIMHDHGGHAIYAGGDDVLGFLPLNTAYQCAASLSDAFAKTFVFAKSEGLVSEPTLSVGLAISHVLTPLSTIREHAKKAEKIAKGDHLLAGQRNALAVLLDVRSGSELIHRMRWSDVAAHEDFKCWMESHVNKKIPSRVAYDARAIADRLRKGAEEPEDLQALGHVEFRRVIDRATTIDGKKLESSLASKLLARVFTDTVNSSGLGKDSALSQLSNEMILARWLSARTADGLEVSA